jgi:hypothetical protein
VQAELRRDGHYPLRGLQINDLVSHVVPGSPAPIRLSRLADGEGIDV